MPQALQSKISFVDSGVDMAFDALMNLEENSDLTTFMRSHMKRRADSDCQMFEAEEEVGSMARWADFDNRVEI